MTVTVHPRLRGELFMKMKRTHRIPGSSPLTRGTRGVSMSSRRLRPVHPRLRGELTRGAHRLSNIDGSSPLTRGTLINAPEDRIGSRFIPAYAGNSRSISSAMSLSPVHPRLRGELGVLRYRSGLSCGSSPLTRGTHCQFGWSDSSRRFIPAYAGNSPDPSCGCARCPVHPRLRGEL